MANQDEFSLEGVMQKIHNESFEKWVENFSLNLSDIWKETSAKELKQMNNDECNSAIVIGRGPSLKKNDHLKILAESKFKGCIICCDGILKEALDAGVTPSKFKKFFVVTIDPHTKIKKFYDYKIINEFGKQIEGIFTTISDPTTVCRAREAGIKINWMHSLFDLNLGKKSFNYISSMIVKTKKHQGLPAIQTGGNVGTSSWFVGWRILGCKTIALIGINHSWEETDPIELIMRHGVGKNDSELEKNSEKFNRLFPKIYNPELKKNYILDPLFQFYRNGFLEFIERSPRWLRTINATGGGSIFGERVITMPFDQFLKIK